MLPSDAQLYTPLQHDKYNQRPLPTPHATFIITKNHKRHTAHAIRVRRLAGDNGIPNANTDADADAMPMSNAAAYYVYVL